MDTQTFKHNNIRLIRTVRRMSAKRLANLTGYSQAYISRLECGRRRLNTQVMYRLSHALNCSVHTLISQDLTYVVQSLTAENQMATTRAALNQGHEHLYVPQKTYGEPS